MDLPSIRTCGSGSAGLDWQGDLPSPARGDVWRPVLATHARGRRGIALGQVDTRRRPAHRQVAGALTRPFNEYLEAPASRLGLFRSGRIALKKGDVALQAVKSSPLDSTVFEDFFEHLFGEVKPI